MLTKDRKLEIKKIADKYIDKTLFEIAEEKNIEIIYADLTKLWNGNISWAISIAEEKSGFTYQIYIEAGNHQNRQTFTLAHELWHAELHIDLLRKKNQIIDEDNWYLFREDIFENVSDEMIEVEEEANEFAWNILMPEKKVKEAWKITKDLSKLADFFNVSVSAMSYRIYLLKLNND